MDNATRLRIRLLLLALAFEGGVGGIAFLAGWYFELSPIEHLTNESAAWQWGLIGSVPMLLAGFLTDRLPWSPMRRLREVVDRDVVPLFAHSTIVDFALIAASAGIGEELLFRGLIQDGCREWLGSPGWAIAIASLIFGLLHPISIEYFAVVSIVGAYLGWLYIVTGNLLAPIVSHAAYDFVMLIYLVRWRSKATDAEESEAS